MQKPAASLRSKSQMARVSTELWAASELYCAACPSPKLLATPANTRTVDFLCPSCNAAYQLKSSSKPFGKRILGASYHATMEASTKGKAPHLLLLHYSAEWVVISLTLVPSFSIPASAIEQRLPLGPTARRAGWIGCNIVLDQVPETAKLNLVTSGKEALSKDIRATFMREKPLDKLGMELRGWTLDVLHIIQDLPGESFSIADIYVHENNLAQKHPGNQNIRAKIRQQLQVLRDIGLISFLGRGSYKRVFRSN